MNDERTEVREVWSGPAKRIRDEAAVVDVQLLVELRYRVPRFARRLIGWLLDRFCRVGVTVAVCSAPADRRRVIELARYPSRN